MRIAQLRWQSPTMDVSLLPIRAVKSTSESSASGDFGIVEWFKGFALVKILRLSYVRIADSDIASQMLKIRNSQEFTVVVPAQNTFTRLYRVK